VEVVKDKYKRIYDILKSFLEMVINRTPRKYQRQREIADESRKR